MVRACRLGVDANAADPLRQRRADEGVIDPPLAVGFEFGVPALRIVARDEPGVDESILSRDAAWKKALHAAIFPGVQGSLHTQIIAAKAVCLGEALQPAFKRYGAQVKTNAVVLADRLSQRGIELVSGGTDTHLVLLDLRRQQITGTQAQAVLDAANITSNKNPIPFDARKPSQWVGLRLGVAAVTTRGFGVEEMRRVGHLIARRRAYFEAVPPLMAEPTHG